MSAINIFLKRGHTFKPGVVLPAPFRPPSRRVTTMDRILYCMYTYTQEFTSCRRRRRRRISFGENDT
jgi:hypothetical protein